jgi:hypothetical protein
MGIVTHLDWVTQLYYDVFHADKNHFINCVWAPTVDACNNIDVSLDGGTLSDDLCDELARVHNLGNLNVRQSEAGVNGGGL